jgi:predicted transcriptional regulator
MAEGEVQTRNGLYGFEFRDVDLRRSDLGERKTYEIKALWQRSHEIVNLAAQGFKQVDIARILNIDPQTVSNTLNSQLGEEKLAVIRKSRDEEAKVVSEKIRVLTDKAINVYHEIFDDESGNLSLMNKKEVADTVMLELSGLRVPTRIQSQSSHAFLTSTELDEFKRRGIEAARESGMIVEVPSEDIKEEVKDETT